MELCQDFSPQRVRYPEAGTKDEILKFNSIHLQHKLSHVIYADFESALLPIDGAQPNPDTSFTNKVHEHVPVAVGMLLVGPNNEHIQYFDHLGFSCVKIFMEKLREWQKFILEEKQRNIAIPPNWRPRQV